MKFHSIIIKSFSLFFSIIPFLIQAQTQQRGAASHSGLQEIEKVSQCERHKPGIVYNGKASITDTSECYIWPFQGEDWQLQNITMNTYNEHALLVEAITKSVDPETQALKNALRYIYAYNEDQSLKSEIFQIWNPELHGGVWDNTMKETFEYNPSGKLELARSWYSSFGDTTWQGAQQKIYSYNDQGMKDTLIVKYWNNTQNDWYYSYRYRYYYNEDNEVTESYLDWANNLEGDFNLNERTIFERDHNQMMLDEVRQFYNLQEWVNDEHYLSELNNEGLPVSVLYQNWDPQHNMWDTLVMNRQLYTYNSQSQVIEYKTQSYYIEWVDMERTYTDYYDSGEIMETLTQEYESFNEEWRNTQKCIFPQNIITGINSGIANDNNIKIYPNPATDKIFLRNIVNPTSMDLINASGQQVYQAPLESSDHVINLSGLKEGLYFLRLISENEKRVSKVLIAH